jgi:hypothetical protein
MLVSLYCSPTHLRLLVGDANSQRVTIDEFRELALPEQSMINGIIINPDAMLRFFQDVSQQFGPYTQDATLVIESNNIRTKVMTLPAVKEGKLSGFVQQDFGEISEEDDVFDFTVLGPNRESGGLEVLGIAAGRVLLKNYIDVLESARFKLKVIDVGTNALAKVAHFIPQLQVSNTILVHSDDNALTLTLYEQGMYRISQKYRLLNPPESVERYREVANNISSMVQFQKSRRRDISIETILVLNDAPEYLPAFVEATGFLEIPVAELNLDAQVKLVSKAGFEQTPFIGSKYLYNIGSMVRK